MDYFDVKNKKKLGKGGQGSVFKITSKRDSLTYVYKQYKNQAALERETSILSQIDNEFIIKPICIDKHEVGLMLPLLKGGDLTRRQDISDRQLKLWIAQLITAVEYLHKRGIVHLDIKPKNLGLNENNNLVLFDFGLSKRVESIKRRVGTSITMAPEMALRKLYHLPLTEALDWWSVGSTIWQLNAFSRIPRKQRKHFDEVVYPYELVKQDNEYVEYLYNEYPAFFSKELKSLIKMMMVEDPSKRMFDLDMERIKGHAYFQDIIWDNLAYSENSEDSSEE